MLEPDAMPPQFEFHHMGWATTDLDRDVGHFELMGFVREHEVFVDPLQGISGCFLTLGTFRVEILTALSGSTTLAPWLNAGIRFYHSAYVVDDVAGSVAWARRNRAKLVVPPTPAVAFDHRPIAFVMFRNGALVEFVERER